MRFELDAALLGSAAVTNDLPMVSVIIPTRPGQAEVPSVAASRALDYPREKLEIIVTRGRQPAVQRNVALQAAQGELVYFIDDDCIPARDALRRGVAHFAQPEVKMVSGPNVCPADAPLLEKVFVVVQTSWLAFGPSRARYEPVGEVRATTEKELIGCNLLARRKTVIDLGGWHEALYPNEDHPLYAAMQRSGGRMIYDPQFLVHRRPRPTLKAFIKMLMNYGRGRAEEFRLYPTMSAAPNFVPPLFCLYLLIGPWLGMIGLVPLAFYGAAVLAQTAYSAVTRGLGMSLLALPLVVLTHLFYGVGFWKGLFTHLRKPGEKPPTEVVLDRFPV